MFSPALKLQSAARVVPLALGLLWATSASAAAGDDQTVADALFDAGRQLMAEGKYDEACPKLESSFEADPGVGTLLNLGVCYEKAGKTASAWSTYREAAALARKEGQLGREELARTEQQRLEAQLIRLTVNVSPETAEIAELEITRDGVPLSKSAWGIAVPIDPGTILIEASAPGYETMSLSVEATEAGKTLSVTVEELPPLKSASPESSQAAAASEPQSNVSGGKGPWPWVLGGVGVAALGTGTAFAFLSKSANDEAEGICVDTEDQCPQDEYNRWQHLTGQAKDRATIAYIGWGVGGAAVIGSAIWLLVGSPDNSTGMTMTPVVGSSSWGLQASGSF